MDIGYRHTDRHDYVSQNRLRRNNAALFRFQIKDEIKAARIEATKVLTRPLATLSRRERGTVYSLPPGER